MSRKKVITLRVDEEFKKALEDMAKEKGIGIAEMIREVLEAFLEPKREAPINKYEFLDDGCELRDYLDEEEAPKSKNYGEGFYCMKKAPSIIKLGSGVDTAANKICSKCLIRDTALTDSRRLKEQREKGIKLEMPRCLKGGYPSEDLLKMYCPKIGKYRPVDKKIKKTDYTPCRLEGPNNSNCSSLRKIVVVKGLKEEEDENK